MLQCSTLSLEQWLSEVPMQSEMRIPIVEQRKIGSRSLRVVRWLAAEGMSPSRPLLFFNGMGGNVELMAPFLEALVSRDVLTFDMPGIGESDPAGGPYLPSRIAEISEQILASFGYQEVDVMGVSWGGMIAAQFAFQYPGRVGRLILAASSPGILMVPGKLSAIALMLDPRKFTDPGFLRQNFGTLYGGGKGGWEQFWRGVREPSSAGYLYQVLALVSWAGLTLLPRIKAKTLILAGADDNLVPTANGHILKFLLNDADLRFLDDAGHMFLLTHREQAVAIVEEFSRA